jgi:uncharacterized protein YjbJ (UPF0337 family)
VPKQARERDYGANSGLLLCSPDGLDDPGAYDLGVIASTKNSNDTKFRHKISTTQNQEELMNKDQVSGKIDQAVGKVQQSVGETVGSEKLANKGVVNQTKGAVKETWGDAKDAAKQIQDSHKKAASEKAAESREKISQSVDDTKEKAKGKIEEFKQRHSA